MIRIEKYYCDLCDKEFDTEEELKEHESTHYTNWEEADNKKIAEELRHLPDCVYDYNVSGTILGHFVSDFKNLMYEAAKRTEEAKKMSKTAEDTADVVPVIHAHWILDPNGMDFGLSAWKCSNCGRQNTMIPSFIPTKCGGYVPKNPNVFAGSNYCPNCGAKMDEETKDETNN